MNNKEYLLNEENNRLSIYPIKNIAIWNLYKKQQAAFWTSEEIDFSKDYEDFQKLNKNEQYFIKMVLAFFSSSDTIVNINLAERFLNEIKIREAIVTYTWQMMMECIHCVSEDTLILTDIGFIEINKLENKFVNVWNGKFFSETIVIFTGISELYEIILSNGISLKCTSEHKWFIDNNSCKKIVYSKDLEINDKIYNFNLPILNIIDQIFINNPYYDGYNYLNYKNNKLLFELINSPNVLIDVPINYSINTKIKWFEGFINYLIKNNLILLDKQIKILNLEYCINKSIQLFLLTFNIKSLIKENLIFINFLDFFKLYEYNFNIKFTYTSIEYLEEINNIKVVNIIKLEEKYKTYCFNEPYEHAGIFNGVLTSQSETYSLQIDNIIKDVDEKNKLFNALNEFPFIANKANWSFKWIESNDCFAKRLLAFVIVEGIFFSGSFCSIFWLKKKNIMPGLCNSNELIARDEGNHCKYAILLYSMLSQKLEEFEVHEIFKEAVDIEILFICESLPCDLLGMNSKLMSEYIKYVADRLLVDLNYNKIYNSKNPFDFMESISVEGKTNFFESRPTQYQKASILNKSKDNIFNLTNNF
jgi:ribonucleotide reductase beta subunit family protein with ferritin-like domain